jgi:GH15 family glucan-1,4-alpha-glucosidase
MRRPSTSLPEQLGGVRNRDYRYCWLRDATFTLYALIMNGFVEEAVAWREWLIPVVAGSPSQIQIMYGLAGERRLPELVLPWLPGYGGAAPVRIGNAASTQRQLDIFGELMDTLYLVRRRALPPEAHVWPLQRALIAYLESVWLEPDEGIWEVRGPRRHFTHSKVMAWVAMDRSLAAAERFNLEAPLHAWRRLRDTIHAQVCQLGFDRRRNAFVQYYGGTSLDASLLRIPLVGFLPPDDPGSRGRSGPSRKNCRGKGWSSAIAPIRKSTASPPERGCSYPAASGWSTISVSRVASPRAASCSSASSRSGTTSGSWRKSTIPGLGACSGTSLRLSPTSR